MKKQHVIAGTMAGALLMVGLAGCATGSKGKAEGGREVPLEQRYDLETVKLRAAELKPGMPKSEVYLLLGAPAEYRGDTWVYRGGVDGSKEFVVRFRDDRYASHSG